VLLAGSVTPGYAVTVECIPQSCKCDPDITDKCVRVQKDDCCKEPDCEFFEAIVKARAWRNVLQRIKQRHLGNRDAARDYTWFKRVKKTELDKEHAKYASCPKNYLKKRYNLFVEVENNCAITVGFGKNAQALSLQDLQLNSNACSEVVAADYAEAQKEAEFCDELVEANVKEDLSTFLDQRLAMVEENNDSLEESLWTYYHRCTDMLGAKMQREVANKGLDALIDKAMPKPPPKKAKPKKPGKQKTKPAKRP
jgi:hypothetical protein